MPSSRRIAVAAGVATAMLVAVPSYAVVRSPQTGSAQPAATPSRISTNAPAAPGATPTSAPGASATATGGASTAPGATSSTGPTGSATSSVRPAPSTTYAPPALGSDAPAPVARNLQVERPFDVQPAPAGGLSPDSSWPDAGQLFTETELAQVVPGLSGVRASDCQPGQLPGGGSTARNATCTLTLTLRGEPAEDASRLVVSIRSIGAPDAVGRSWSSTLAAQRARSGERPGLYTFYRNGVLGASSAYTDGTTTRVLVQRPGLAAEVWFSGIGFTRLKPTYEASREAFRTEVSPGVIQLLAGKMARAQ